MKNAILVALLMIVTLGCGIKRPPVPMSTVVPKRILDLGAVSREESVILTWTVPKENADKTVLTDLAEFKLLKTEGTLVGGECRGCGGEPKVFYEMKMEGKEDLRGKRISATLDELDAGKVYVFTVVSVNKRGYLSPPSNPVQVFWDYPPHRPSAVSAERGDKRVDLSWQPVAGASGYNIYRKGEGEEAFGTKPLNRDPINATLYTDLNVENEKKFVYSIRAVRKVGKTEIEGKGSLEIPVTPTDLIPPRAPVDLVAVPLKTGIELNWRKNEEPDLLGYTVFKRLPGETEFKRLNEDPVTKETYLDTDVNLGQDYEYAVSAVDNSPHRNTSPLSEEVRIKYLY